MPFFTQREICRIIRWREIRGVETVETVSAMTSLTQSQAGAEALLALCRGHWGIENRLPTVRDASYREDQCLIHARAGPQVLAACRNTSLTIIRRSGRTPVEAFEHCAEHRQDGLDAVIGRRAE